METRMQEEEKVERALLPYFGSRLPKKAQEKALNRVKKGGKLFLLHIVDEAATRSIRYRTGQIGEESELVKTFKETQERVQKSAAKGHAEELKKRAAKRGVSVEPLYVSGDPADEVLKVIEEHSIDLVLVERLREKIAEIFLGDEIDYLGDEASCEVLTVSD